MSKISKFMVRTRIAPSPTGENLHIGNVYTALINFAYAKKNNGKFIIRIEDTDRKRYVEGSEQRILASLLKMHLDYDEGPDKVGSYGPYRQSERLEIYHKYAQELIDKGHAEYVYYPMKGAGEKKDYTKKNDAKTSSPAVAENPPKTIKEMMSRGDWVIRMKIPRDEKIIIRDIIRGDIEFNSNDLSPQVIIKSDGYPTYHLGVVADDHLMEITHVIRAEEWLSSTPKHILLYKYFGWELPVFAHVSLLRNTDHSKLSKRKSPVWVSWFLEQGYLPDAILNFLALLAWSHPEEKEIFPMDEFIKLFDLKDLNTVAPIFDLQKLTWMNGEYMRMMNDEELMIKLLDFYKTDKDITDYLKNSKNLDLILDLAKSRMKTLKEFKDLVLFRVPELSIIEKNIAKIISDKFSVISNWNKDSILAAMREVLKESKVKGNLLYKIITGHESGLPLPESLEILGKEKTLERIKKVF
jgi:glutamyl-tRNA synthetase